MYQSGSRHHGEVSISGSPSVRGTYYLQAGRALRTMPTCAGVCMQEPLT